jgi:drug/metabolite transporter (DMT)-like permease
MRIAKAITVFGFLLGIIGFLIAAFSSDRQLGMSVFLVGFFLLALGIVTLNLLGQPRNKRGIGLRIAACGFGLVALGQLIYFAFATSVPVDTISFAIGSVVMVIGIVIHLVNITRPN